MKYTMRESQITSKRITNKQITNKQLQTNQFLTETFNIVKKLACEYAQKDHRGKIRWEDYSKEMEQHQRMRNTTALSWWVDIIIQSSCKAHRSQALDQGAEQIGN